MGTTSILKIFQTLEIGGTPAQLAAVIEDMSRTSGQRWVRSLDAEVSANRGAPSASSYTGFETANSKLPIATVWLLKEPSETRMSVVNIVPRSDRFNLEYDEYNAIVTGFYKELVSPSTRRIGATASLGPTTVDVGTLISPRSWSLLESVVEFCKRGSIYHPDDRVQWFQFIISSAQEPTPLSVDILERLLNENRCREDLVTEMVGNYEDGLELLELSSQPVSVR